MSRWTSVIVFIGMLTLYLSVVACSQSRVEHTQEPTADLTEMWLQQVSPHASGFSIKLNIYNPNPFEGILEDIVLQLYVLHPVNKERWVYLGSIGVEDLRADMYELSRLSEGKLVIRSSFNPLYLQGTVKEAASSRLIYGFVEGRLTTVAKPSVLWMKAIGRAKISFDGVIEFDNVIFGAEVKVPYPSSF